MENNDGGDEQVIMRTISTGSQGNCYILDDGNRKLLLDLGVSMKEIKPAIDFDVGKVMGALVTHCHKDHSKSVSDFEKMGIPVIKPYDDGNDARLRNSEGISVMPFPVEHDVPCYGFLIIWNGTKILYVTDTCYVKYNFKRSKVDYIIVECNYQAHLIGRYMANYEHKVCGHMEVNVTTEFIRQNVTRNLKGVILVHMGYETCNIGECVAQIKKVVNDSVFVDYAKAGYDIDLRKREVSENE